MQQLYLFPCSELENLDKEREKEKGRQKRLLDEKNRRRKQKFKRANEKIAAKRKADAKRAEDEAKFLALKNKHAKEKKKREDADAEMRRQDNESRRYGLSRILSRGMSLLRGRWDVSSKGSTESPTDRLT